jgi:hypothetical protein
MNSATKQGGVAWGIESSLTTKMRAKEANDAGRINNYEFRAGSNRLLEHAGSSRSVEDADSS